MWNVFEYFYYRRDFKEWIKAKERHPKSKKKHRVEDMDKTRNLPIIKTKFIESPKTILLDFDGTCTGHKYPGMGNDLGAIPTLKELVANGCRLILFTARGSYDTGLEDAKQWFVDNDIELYGIQTNPTQGSWTNSPKPYGTLIIDDTALGIPLKFDKEISEKPYVDWPRVRVLLREIGYL